MAYQKQSERILAGGLSLLPPGEKLNDGMCPQLENWRSDQAGQLMSRRGMQPESAVIEGPIHTLFRIGNDRYAGAGSNLRRGSNIENVIASGFDGKPLGIAAANDNIFVMNQSRRLRNSPHGVRNWGIAAPTTAPVASPGAVESAPLVEFDEAEGWDVYFIGATEQETTKNATVEVVVTDAGTVSVTNGSATVNGVGTNWTETMVGLPIRIFGVNFDTFTTVASVSGPTTLTITGNYTDVSESGLAYRITRTASARNWDSSNKQSGTHSLHVAANPPGKYQVRREEFGPVDTRLGNADDADIFQLWFYASRPQFIESIYIELYSGTGATRPLAFAIVDPSLLNQGSFSWTHLDIRRGLDTWAIVSQNEEYMALQTQAREAEEAGDSAQASTLRAAAQQLFDQILKNTPYFRYTDAFNWGQVTRMVVEVNVSQACDFHLDQMRVIGGVSGPLDGEASFFVTYGNNEGHESLPSEPSEPIVLKRQSATVQIPVSPDPQVDRRYLYRVGAGLNAPAYRVLVIWDNVTTTCITTMSNEEAQRNNERLRQDTGLPPPAKGLVGPYLNRLIAFNSAAHPNRYWYTPEGEPQYWEDANDPDEGSWEDLGEAYEEIVNATTHKRSVWFYKQKSIWRLSGDPETSSAEQTNANVGLAAERAVVNAGSVDYFFGGKGIYRFNGDFEELISQQIDPIFKGEYAQFGNIDIPPLNQDYAHTCVMGLYHQRLFFSYPEAGQTQPSVTLEYDLQTGRWFHFRTALGTGGFTAMTYEGTGNQMLAAANVPGGARLFDLNGFSDDAGQPIQVIWQSRYLDQGAADTEKTYSDVVIDFATARAGQLPSVLTVQAVFDNGTVMTLGTISSASRTRRTFSINNGAGVKAMNFAIRVTGSITSQCWIYNAWVHWYYENRKGLSFDTGVVQLAGGDPAETDVFEAEITTAQQVHWQLYTDLPGGAVALRQAGSLMHSPGRRVEPVRFTKQTGRTGRLLFHSAGLFQMHSLRQRVRRFGTYIDGAKGQIWNPLPFRLGDGRMVQLKDLLVEYEAPQGGSLTVQSNLGAVRSMQLPASAIQRTEIFTLDGMEGDLWEWSGSSSGPLKIFAATLRFRAIGVWFNGAKGEFWEVEFDLGQPHHFREFELDLDTSGPMQFTVSLELPGQNLAARGAYMVNTEVTTPGRRPWNMRGPGTLKGQLLRLRLAGGAIVRMWGGRVYARPLNSQGSWRWIALPIPETPVDWITTKLPIGQTDLGWQWIQFPMDAVG
jgi:hypothetical protein